jgi:drug/metabolite transporter (DMT)-like permease
LLLDRLKPWAMPLAWLTPGLWAVNAVISRAAPGIIEPFTLSLGRFALAGLILTVWARTELQQHGTECLRKPWPYVLLSFLGMFLCGAMMYMAGRTTGAVNIGLIYATSPIIILLASAWWLGEQRLGPRQWLGVALALLGVLHVVTGGQIWRLAQIQWVEGDFWVLLCAVSFSFYVLLLRKTPTALSEMGRLALLNVISVFMLLPFAIAEMLAPNTPAFSGAALGLIVAATVFPSLGAYLIYAWAQSVLGAARVSVTMYLGPLWNAVLAWLLLGEQMGSQHWVGAVLILPGIYLATRK